MEGDVIVMQDVFVFEQTGIVDGKIQGRLKPTGIRPKFVEKFEVMGIHLPPRPVRLRVLGRRQGDRSWTDASSSLVVAAGAILLIVLGLATSGGGSGISARLERYASGKPEAEPTPRQPGGDRRRHRPERGPGQPEQGRRAARLRREPGPRHRPGRPQAQGQRVPRASGRRRSSACRCHVPGPRLRPAGRSATRSSCSIGAVIGFCLPRFWLDRRKSGRLNAFNKQLPDTITLIANALRAGSSFLQAIELVVREARPPISTEFGRVIREVNLGLPFDDALENMVRRVRSDDLELMATAISIQHQVGGNLAEILDSIAFTIRERVRIKGEIRTLTAQQRLSGYVVGFLPIGLAGFLFIVAPGFMDPMFDKPPDILGLPAGVIILFVGGFMMFIGFMFIRKHRRHRGLSRCCPSSSSPRRRGGHPAHRRSAWPAVAPVDPVQARLTQLGSMQAKNLEELELQQPFFERTLRPLAARLSRHRSPRITSASFAEPDREAPGAWPATRATCGSPTGWASRPSSAIVVGASSFLLLRRRARRQRRLRHAPGRSSASADRLHRSRSSGSAAGSGRARRPSC